MTTYHSDAHPYSIALVADKTFVDSAISCYILKNSLT